MTAENTETAHTGQSGPDTDKKPVKTAYSNGAYRIYVLLMLTVIYVLNFVDRQLLVILQEPIKAELNLSDTQLGLLTGFAFALFYVICGIPIARWADKGVRRNIIALAVTVWSVMTALCGVAGNYTHLLLARVGVGVGEAGGSPPAHSMISDIFKPKNRALALSVYSIGIYIGILIGFALGSRIADMFSWRLAFLVVGLPGVLVAIILRLTVREPIRGWAEGTSQEAVAAPPVLEVAKLLWTRVSFRHIALAASLQAFLIYGIGNWFPSYFLRNFDLSLSTVGTWMALTSGLGGGLGSFFGGWMADRFGASDVRWYLWTPAMLTFLIVPVLAVALTSGSAEVALLLTAPFNFLTAAYLGSVIAVSHSLVSARMRALTSAVLFFVLNLIGLGMGPLFVGAFSDFLTKSGSETPLATAMLVSGIIGALWACVHYVLAAKSIRQDIARLEL
jgi:MFS family permease